MSKIPARVYGQSKARAALSRFSASASLPLERYIHAEQAGGIMLILGAAAALIWVNSPWAASYHAVWEASLALDLGFYQLREDARHWINDGLMVLFFFVIGLEIKRELVHGELSEVRHATLPMFAALGGMVLPAGFYYLLTFWREGQQGWGIPVATDIAFALGVLMLLGDRVPREIKVFLLAFATVDDIGGILIIAIFYAEYLAWMPMLVSAGLIAALLALRYYDVRSVPLYLVLGVLLWLAVHKSGIHATIAGVALGLLTPARRYFLYEDYHGPAAEALGQFQRAVEEGNEERATMYLGQLEELTRNTEEPAERVDRLVRPWVNYLILPLFALANAGVALSWESVRAAVSSPVAQGIMAGLILGKLIGIPAGSWLAIRLGLADLPPRVNWRHMMGTGLLGGIGFTVSLFIATLAFDDERLLDAAKIGVLAASVLAALAGAAFFWFGAAPAERARTGREGDHAADVRELVKEKTH